MCVLLKSMPCFCFHRRHVCPAQVDVFHCRHVCPAQVDVFHCRHVCPAQVDALLLFSPLHSSNRHESPACINSYVQAIHASKSATAPEHLQTCPVPVLVVAPVQSLTCILATCPQRAPGNLGLHSCLPSYVYSWMPDEWSMIRKWRSHCAHTHTHRGSGKYTLSALACTHTCMWT